MHNLFLLFFALFVLAGHALAAADNVGANGIEVNFDFIDTVVQRIVKYPDLNDDIFRVEFQKAYRENGYLEKYGPDWVVKQSDSDANNFYLLVHLIQGVIYKNPELNAANYRVHLHTLFDELGYLNIHGREWVKRQINVADTLFRRLRSPDYMHLKMIVGNTRWHMNLKPYMDEASYRAILQNMFAVLGFVEKFGQERVDHHIEKAVTQFRRLKPSRNEIPHVPENLSQTANRYRAELQRAFEGSNWVKIRGQKWLDTEINIAAAQFARLRVGGKLESKNDELSDQVQQEIAIMSFIRDYPELLDDIKETIDYVPVLDGADYHAILQTTFERLEYVEKFGQEWVDNLLDLFVGAFRRIQAGGNFGENEIKLQIAGAITHLKTLKKNRELVHVADMDEASYRAKLQRDAEVNGLVEKMGQEWVDGFIDECVVFWRQNKQSKD